MNEPCADKLNIKVRVESLKDNPNYVKCPHCWQYHSVHGNYENLCDRCCLSILEGAGYNETSAYVEACRELKPAILESMKRWAAK